MGERRGRPAQVRRVAPVLWCAVVATMLAVAVAACTPGRDDGDGAAASDSDSDSLPAPPSAAPADQADAGSTTTAEGGEPAALSIPGIGVESPLVGLGVDASGRLEFPASYDVAGWYTGGPAPGELGPAVLVGHVDSTSGPAVFYDLHTLSAGDSVVVTMSDASTIGFTVSGVQSYAKDAFPTTTVYGPTPDPQLRLITCGGTFDDTTGNWESNVVVSAVLATPQE